MKHPLDTHGIPTTLSRETVGVAAGVVPSRNIRERRRRGAIQERVQEPKRRRALRRETVIDERDDAREDWARAARPRNEARLLLEHDLDILALSSDVRECAPAAVELAHIRFPERCQVCAHHACLIIRCREEVGEPA